MVVVVVEEEVVDEEVVVVEVVEVEAAAVALGPPEVAVKPLGAAVDVLGEASTGWACVDVVVRAGSVVAAVPPPAQPAV